MIAKTAYYHNIQWDLVNLIGSLPPHFERHRLAFDDRELFGQSVRES